MSTSIDLQKLYDNSADFFGLGGNAIMKLDREAALDLCLQAATRELVLIKIEGGIWRNGKFEARLDAIWDGSDPPLSRGEAGENNARAADFIRSTAAGYNAFVATTASIEGYAHKRSNDVPHRETFVAE
jgi:hypothetical protein